MGCEGFIRGMDLWVGFLSPWLGQLAGIWVKSESKGENKEKLDRRPAARTVPLFHERDPAVPSICTCYQVRGFVGLIWVRIHVQVI